ncbi:MAG TPA: substrate-binding domain-containing protein [Xanthobacteraceae bacterium]|nr:substrate-binding domain-containing protein [Xanthobacteraceae bacterium]
MAADLKVMSARAVKAAVSTLAAQFSRAHGCAVTFDFAPVGTLESRLAAGERADVVILSRAVMASVAQSGLFAPDSVRELGSTPIGLAVRAGAHVPDISTPDAFKAVLLAADKIALSDPAIGGTAARYLPQLFARMDIAEAIEPRLVRCRGGGGEVAERVARGEAEVGMTFVSEMLPIAGVTIAGPLPAPYGRETGYCAAVCAQSSNAATGADLIAALADPTGDAVWRSAGFAR